MQQVKTLSKIIQNRYKILHVLGQGGMATTYKAKCLISEKEVVLKVVSLRQASDWKILELFEREAEILAKLDHVSIPTYLDYFELDTETDRYFCLVRELVSGSSLAELIQQNWQYDLNIVLKIAISILEILKYLHSLNPPVIHRDIKPENIIRKADGSIYLVDFGSVQSAYRNSDSYINTFVGTLGYMPPEQFSGRVSPASDLYSLGCTLLFLLTKRCPTELPLNRLKIDFKSQINLSDDLADWLEKILEPALEDRFQSATSALKSLPPPKPKNKPLISNSSYSSTNSTLWSQEEDANLFLIQKGNTLLINCPKSSSFQPQVLTIQKQIFTLYIGNDRYQHIVKGKTSDLAVSVVKKELGTANQNIYCTITDGNHFYNFGYGLTSDLQETIVHKVASFIEKHKISII